MNSYWLHSSGFDSIMTSKAWFGCDDNAQSGHFWASLHIGYERIYFDVKAHDWLNRCDFDISLNTIFSGFLHYLTPCRRRRGSNTAARPLRQETKSTTTKSKPARETNTATMFSGVVVFAAANTAAPCSVLVAAVRHFLKSRTATTSVKKNRVTRHALEPTWLVYM